MPKVGADLSALKRRITTAISNDLLTSHLRSNFSYPKLKHIHTDKIYLSADKNNFFVIGNSAKLSLKSQQPLIILCYIPI
jgi:hypothetical protein